MGRQRISILRLSKDTGINRTSLGRRLAGETSLTVDELTLIAERLRVPIGALMAINDEKASA